MIRRLKNESGMTFLGTLIALMGVMLASSALVRFTSDGMLISANEIRANQALHIGNAGLQYALNKLENGVNPHGTTKTLVNGDFAIQTFPITDTVRSTSHVGEAERIQKITAKNFAKNCIEIDSSKAKILGNDLKDIYIKKTCNDKIIITEVNFAWESGGSIVHIDQVRMHTGASIIWGPGQGNSGETLDVIDETLITNDFYDIDFLYDSAAPVGVCYTLKLYFSDESQKAHGFCMDPAGLPTGQEGPIHQGDGFMVQADQDIDVMTQKQISLEFLGTAITCGAEGQDVEVRADLKINGGTFNPLFGDSPIQGGETHIETTGAGMVTYVIQGRASLPQCLFSSTHDSNNLDQAIVLVDGDRVPDFNGANNQESVADFLQAYVDGDGNLQLGTNQAIVLFELGIDLVANPKSPHADFQDLVVLLTVTDV